MSPENMDKQSISELEIERLKMMELADKMREKLPPEDEISYASIAARALTNQEKPSF